MSDERSPAAAPDETGADDDADTTGPNGSSDSLEPGGGPQRVVSEQSVDDILDSLDATESEPTASNDATATTTETRDGVTAEFDEDDIPDADEATTDEETVPDADDSERPAPTDDAAENEPASDTGAAVDGSPSLPDDPSDASLEELAARVEDGTVTGADVRAAEAGEGRESTPEIDDVDLSMDDLETTGSGASATGDDWPGDAGPLAGSMDGDAGGSDGHEPADENPGLLGRLKRFFSR